MPHPVLLLEFLSADPFRQFRSDLFPFYYGHAVAHGVPVRWLTLGVRRETLADPFIMEPRRAEIAQLAAIIAAHQPRVLLCNERWQPQLCEEFAQRWPDLRVALTDQDMPQWQLRAHVDEVFGLPPSPGPRYLVDVAQPRHAPEALNDLARQLKPIIKVISGPNCVYARPMDTNPCFAGLDLPPGMKRHGCSFCGATLEKYPYETPLLPLVLAQIHAAVRDVPADQRADVYLIDGILAFLHLRDLTQALLAAALPPSTFLFGCRVDELLRAAPVLDDVLPRLAASGHALHIQNIGVENLSPAENERLNKHISVDEVRRALEHLTRWEASFPQAFSFWRQGGFGFITFTPWTTLADLQANLDAIESTGLLALSRQVAAPTDLSLFATSRLILLPGRALTLLAERDGLLEAQFADAAAASNASGGCLVSWQQHELPWRFARPEVAAIYAVLARLVQSPGAPHLQDALALQLRKIARDWPTAARAPAQLLADLVRAAQQTATADPLALVHALGRLPQRQAARREWQAGERMRQHIVARFAPAGTALRGLRLVGTDVAVAQAAWEVRLTLTGKDSRLVLYVRAAHPDAYLTVGSLSIAYDRETPIDSEQKRRAVRAVAAALI